MSLEQDTITQVEIQKNKVEALYDLVGSMTNEMSACTHAMTALTTQFAVYTEKHDNTEKSLQALVASQTRIQEMKPTVDSVRGLVWRVITAIILGMGGLGVLVAELIK